MKTNFNFIPVKSSNVDSVAYDMASQTLAVQFKGSKPPYLYSDVPQELFTRMGKADSVGKFIGSHIVGQFKHQHPGA